MHTLTSTLTLLTLQSGSITQRECSQSGFMAGGGGGGWVSRRYPVCLALIMYTHTWEASSDCRGECVCVYVCEVTCWASRSSAISPTTRWIVKHCSPLCFTAVHEYYIFGILIILDYIVIFMICYHRARHYSVSLFMLYSCRWRWYGYISPFQELKWGFIASSASGLIIMADLSNNQT